MADNDGGNGTGTENGGNGNDAGNQQNQNQNQNQNQQNGNSGGNQNQPPPNPDAKFTQDDIDRVVKERVERERKKYSDYDDLKKAAQGSKTLEQQVAELTAQAAERDARDVERAGALAAEKLKTRLVRDGLSDDDAATIAGSVDSMSLLDEGVPDDKAIDKLGKSLSKAAGRPSSDPDAGRSGGEQPKNMNDLIRSAVQRGRVR